MNNGIMGELLKNKKGALYTMIKYGTANAEAHYSLQNGEEKIFYEGAKVTFETRPPQKGSQRPSAYNVCLIRTDASHTSSKDTKNQEAEKEIKAKYYLPKDTYDLLFATEAREKNIDNTALKMQKYLPVYHKKEDELKVHSAQMYSQAEKKLLSLIARKQLDVLSAYEYSSCITGILGARMVVGLGSGSVLETAITLHHTYGFPYLPGSAVKGCLRSFIIRDLFDGKEEDALADGGFAEIFGAHGQRGGIVFLDSFPVKCDQLDLDIMNPHYADYYQGKQSGQGERDEQGKRDKQDRRGKQGMCAPTDDQNPNPIKFNAVPKDTQFIFRIASNKLDIRQSRIKDSSVIDLFKTMLSEIGVGAKTAVGYGWFGNVKERDD